VDGNVVGSIEGWASSYLLLGVTHADGPAEVAWMARKVWELRIMRAEKSASDLGAPVLVVSQFTLYGDAARAAGPPGMPRRGRSPSRSTRWCARSSAGSKVSGELVTNMRGLVNDGPVTLVSDAITKEQAPHPSHGAGALGGKRQLPHPR
jgi:D-tyrosyl-tRNA(Tyr) deacylase